MCGILGIYNFNGQPIQKNLLINANNEMFYRGPDDDGYFIDNNYGMAMRRLSIIDIDKGTQPIFNKIRDKVIIFNGEIYNYLELKKDLQNEGFIFKTNSDTEVIINLFDKYKYDCVKYLNGMFAFSIWDKKEKEIFISRDRFGIKPLVYYIDNNTFCYASSIKSLKILLNNNTQLDYNNLLTFFASSYIRHPYTAYRDIYKLEPAHSLIIKNNKMKKIKYWDLQVNNDQFSLKSNYNNYISRIKSILDDSIKINSRSDVKNGTFLSGGLDSSYITTELQKQSINNIATFTASFPHKINDEADIAMHTAKSLGTEHHNILIDAKNVNETLFNVLPEFDEPIADSAIVPTYLLSKEAASNNVKVILSGAGGDEIFGGYSRYYWRKRDLLTGIYSKFSKKLLHAVFKNFSYDIYDANFKLIDKKLNFTIDTSGLSLSMFALSLNKIDDYEYFLDRTIENNNIMDQYNNHEKSYTGMLTDINDYLVNNILSLTDKASMYNSVEIRVPFLDHRLVETFFSLPAKTNISRKLNKKILREIINKNLSKKILMSPKTGFNAPIESWFQETGSEIDNNIQSIKSNFLKETFNLKHISNISKNKKITKRSSEFLFMLFTLENWLNKNE